MHTSEQALSLWCPMVRFEGDVGGSFNRGYRNSNPTNLDAVNKWPPKPILAQEHGCHCISDQCAMWRWEHTTASVPTTTLGASGEPARTFEIRTVRTHGYCGLAGSPAA